VPRPPAIELRNVTKVYGEGRAAVDALRGINLVVHRGEYVSVIGPSGSGKSTLVHIIGCLDRPTSGTYLLGGIDVTELGDNDLAEIRNRQIGFVFQNFNLLQRATALENVELPLIYRGMGRRTRRKLAAEMLERVDLADRMHHTPGQLSGGEQQRVAIARALVTDPLIVLADEPTGNLDSARSAELLKIFDELHQEGRTIVMITHELDVAKRAARRVRIRDGEIVGEELSEEDAEERALRSEEDAVP
jgi:putative ABC transport system ATP-binding protein